jgi:glycosyltransferase involved in cell wall biosynthesis
MSNKKTLVILTPGFASSEEDTNCLPLQQYFIRKLNFLFPQLNIVILSFQYPYFQKKYTWFNNTVISYDGRNKGGIPGLLLRRKINAALKETNNSGEVIGLLSFWLGECALVGKRFADRHQLNHYCWIFGQDARKENKYGSRVNPESKELIALSDFLQETFEKNHGVRPAHVIPLGAPPAYNINRAEKDIDIFGAGSLIPLKQYPVFLEIIAQVKSQLPAIRVMLAGNGPEKASLNEMIIRLGLQGTVTLTGELPHSVVLQLMQRTKVFLHPSSYEGFSGVCLEALHNGAHVISFCRAMKQDFEQWHIVQTKDEMKEKILDILQNPKTVYRHDLVFTLEDTGKKIMALFELAY